MSSSAGNTKSPGEQTIAQKIAWAKREHTINDVERKSKSVNNFERGISSGNLSGFSNDTTVYYPSSANQNDTKYS